MGAIPVLYAQGIDRVASQGMLVQLNAHLGFKNQGAACAILLLCVPAAVYFRLHFVSYFLLLDMLNILYTEY